MKKRIGNLFGRLSAWMIVLAVLLSFCFPLSVSAYNDSGFVVGEDSPLAFPETVVGGISAEASSGTRMMERNADGMISMPAEVALLVSALVAIDELGEEQLDNKRIVDMTEFPFLTDVGNLEIPNRAMVTYRDLISLMLLCRSQDAAAILAAEISGKFSSYLELMNYKAGVLNMTGTYFTSVNGVASPEQNTTFSDIVALLKAVSENETMMSILAQTSYTVSESATKLKDSYESVIPASPVPGMVSVFFGSAAENGTVYACIDRRDFTTCTVVLLKDQDVNTVIPQIVELHNTVYERYAVSSLAGVAEVLAKSESLRYYDAYRACYIQPEDYSCRVFLKDVLDKINSDEEYVRQHFSFDYERNYIYSESREPGHVVAVADLRYDSKSLCSAPLYVSDEIVGEIGKYHAPRVTFGELYETYKMYILIAAGAVILLIVVIVIVLLVSRRKGSDSDPDATEDLESAETEESVPAAEPETSEKSEETIPKEKPKSENSETAEEPSAAEDETPSEEFILPEEEPQTEGEEEASSSGMPEIQYTVVKSVPDESVSEPEDGEATGKKKSRRDKKRKKKD